MKKLFSSLSALILSLMMVVNVFAAELKIDNIKVNSDNTTVSVVLSELPNGLSDISGITIKYSYDENFLSDVKVSSDLLLGEGFASKAANGEGSVSWVDVETADETKTYSVTPEMLEEADGVLFDLEFALVDGADGETTVGIEYVRIVDKNLVAATITDVTVTDGIIKLGSSEGDADEDIKSELKIENVVYTPDSVILSVVLSEIPEELSDISGVTIKYSYDENYLANAKASSDLLSGDGFAAKSSSGKGTVSWIDMSTSDETNTKRVTPEMLEAQNGVLFTLEFERVDGAVGETTVAFDYLRVVDKALVAATTEDVKVTNGIINLEYVEVEDPDKIAAEAVIALINAIGEVTLESKAAIEEAEAAYEALTDAQKALVENYADLTAARDTYDDLVEQAGQEAADKAAAEAVIAKIAAIGTVTLESKDVIEAAEAAYAALTDDQKALVENYADLEAARKAYNKLKDDMAAAQVVIDLINSIGEVTLEDGDIINAAFEAYNKLEGDQFALVTNYPVLKEAKVKYDELKAQAEQEAIDKAAAEAVIAKIAAIGEVTLESKAAIEAAEAAYALLTDAQKALVINYRELVDARAEFDALGSGGGEEDYKPIIGIIEDILANKNIKVIVVTSIPANKVVIIAGKTASMITNNDGTVSYVVAFDEETDTDINIEDIGEDDIIIMEPEEDDVIELVMGDANLDGEVHVEDALIIIKKAAELKEEIAQYYSNPLAYIVSDVNANGKITSGDALIVKGIVVGNPKALQVVKPIIGIK